MIIWSNSNCLFTWHYSVHKCRRFFALCSFFKKIEVWWWLITSRTKVFRSLLLSY
jgi:hypothetical protein